MIPHSYSPPRPSTATSARTKSSSLDGKTSRTKESRFIIKHGKRHHAYDNEKAPYPLSYDRQVLELESLDNRLIKHLRQGSVTFVKFDPKELPERCLDLGCGTGTWVIDAANEWPHCEFVGFDLVNIQIPTHMLDKSISKRISWVHGNFITTKLPFDDGEFDHVHVQNISTGVPENKWYNLFEEISRVLRPGGSIEIIEDDPVFPSLPRWFTSPLRARARRAQSIHLPNGTTRAPEHSPSDSVSREDIPAHDHALLESLYNSVFTHRFVNMKPTAVLPSLFTTYFRQVRLCPVLSFPFPPVPPPPPAPPPMVSSYANDPGLSGLSEALDPRASTMLLSSSKTRPTSLSFSSTMSGSSTMADSYMDPVSIVGSPPGVDRSFTSVILDDAPESVSMQTLVNNELPEVKKGDCGGTEYYPKSQVHMFYMDRSVTDEESLVNTKLLLSLSERSLAMHLYRSYQAVLACQEALWEELLDRLRNRRDELKPFGWDDDDELEVLQNRKKFERLVERYRSDMQTRISLWCSLQDVGWEYPPRDPLSKAELIEEERIREAMLEAKRYAPYDESEPELISRSLRVIVGYNT